jgi:hypothetical protein
MRNESESFALFVGVDVSKSQLDVFLPDSKTRQVRDFAKGIGKDAKTDAIDAEVIATFGQVVKPEPLAAKTEAEEKLAALVTRRSQRLDFINQETNRLQQNSDREEAAHDPQHAAQEPYPLEQPKGRPRLCLRRSSVLDAPSTRLSLARLCPHRT